MSEWFYLENDTEVGPVSSENLRRMVKNGLLPKTSYVCRIGMSNWITAEEFLHTINEELEPAPPPGLVMTGNLSNPIPSDGRVTSLWNHILANKVAIICAVVCLLSAAFSVFLFSHIYPGKPILGGDGGVSAYIKKLPEGEYSSLPKYVRTRYVKVNTSKVIFMELNAFATGRNAALQRQVFDWSMIEPGKEPTYFKIAVINAGEYPYWVHSTDFKARDRQGNEYAMQAGQSSKNPGSINPGGRVILEFIAMLPAGVPVSSVVYADGGYGILIAFESVDNNTQEFER